MCEVTRKNFEEQYSQIIDHLHSSTFIAIDCEFSGLFDDNIKLSLFDSPEIYFKKLHATMANFTILQIGITTFEYNRIQNIFNSISYNFYLMPSCVFKPKSKITFITETFDFLCKHKFDFNKVFYEGISYLNKSEESQALQMIQEETLINNVDKFHLEEYIRDIAEWSGREEEGSEIEINIKNERDEFVYLLHLEVRKRLANIWTYHSKSGNFKVKKILKERKRQLMEDKENETEIKKKLFLSLLGFSRILKEIEDLKKPIIGHNLFVDLVLIYQQFYDSSIITYTKFKQNIHKMFPVIYDTKNMSYNLLRILPKKNSWTSNSLSELYHHFKYGKGASVVIFTPSIHTKCEEFVRSESFHEAAFDSFASGFCFVKMAHIWSLWDEQTKTFSLSSRSTTSTTLFAAVQTMKNCLNISRGQLHHVVLGGNDPYGTRPHFLYIQAKNKRPLSIDKISKVIGKFGAIDIQFFDNYRGLMAVSNQRQMDQVLSTFRYNKDYEVMKYSFLKHSNLRTGILLGAAITSLVFIGLFSFKK